jgi:hypothetical protein
MIRRRVAALVVALVASSVPAVSAAEPSAPPPLSQEGAADLAAGYGGGNLGRWGVDRFGLPTYHYEVDHTTDPRAAQTELNGSRAAWHQVGNDHLMANAHNDGYVQLWSQARLAQWANRWQPADRHFGGGFGYLRVDDEVVSTLYPDRLRAAGFDREFGAGYVRKRVRASGIEIVQDVVAPFGDDPLLVDEVTLVNTTDTTKSVSWFEYWAVNPVNQATRTLSAIGLERPVWDPTTRTLTVAQRTRIHGDDRPHSVFAAVLDGPDGGFESSAAAFFGDGGRARPDAVVADQLTGTIAAPRRSGTAGDTMAGFRAPVTLRPGQRVTLRYAYGLATPEDIPRLVATYRAQAATFDANGRAWASWLPRADFGPEWRWVARELAWAAYQLRSATHYEEECGHHTITQGGYYQYGTGINMGYRSWLHYLLPMVYTEPEIAREILRYSIRLQPPPPAAAQQNPYGTGPLCSRYDLGTSSDMDFWLLLAAGEYGLGTRDVGFFDEVLPYHDSRRSASAWTHLKDAFAHAETQLGPHGAYRIGTMGDWTDFTPVTVGITESMLVTAQLAYAYPKLAEVADLRGDTAFAGRLRAAADRNLATVRRAWTDRGWYTRGFRLTQPVGTGVIFSEPQSWAILAGAPGDAQAGALVANIRRYLTGHGAPGGPSPIGSAQSPAVSDPGVTERTPLQPLLGVLPPEVLDALPPPATVIAQRANSAAWPGNVWYDLNGHLTWALGTLDGRVPGAAEYAWDEYVRNTLGRHATTWPDHWAGTISVDDVCNAYYTRGPARCGGFSDTYDGQITEHPTWMVMNAIRLAGVTPTGAGYTIAPHLPLDRFSLRLPRIGVAADGDRYRGYLRPEGGGELELAVRLPAGADPTSAIAWVDGERVAHRVEGRTVVITLTARAARTTDWAVEW